MVLKFVAAPQKAVLLLERRLYQAKRPRVMLRERAHSLPLSCGQHWLTGSSQRGDALLLLFGCSSSVSRLKIKVIHSENPLNPLFSIIRHPSHDSCRFHLGDNFHFDELPIVIFSALTQSRYVNTARPLRLICKCRRTRPASVTKGSPYCACVLRQQEGVISASRWH